MRRTIPLLLTLLTFLATQPNVQARWRSLLEKLVIKSVCLIIPYWECPAEQRLWLPIVLLYCLFLAVSELKGYTY